METLSVLFYISINEKVIVTDVTDIRLFHFNESIFLI